MKTKVKFYLVDKASTTELSIKPMTENLLETLLVMIVAVFSRVINPTDIKHSVQSFKNLTQAFHQTHYLHTQKSN